MLRFCRIGIVLVWVCGCARFEPLPIPVENRHPFIGKSVDEVRAKLVAAGYDCGFVGQVELDCEFLTSGMKKRPSPPILMWFNLTTRKITEVEVRPVPTGRDSVTT